jgi:hypothetical protein
MINPEDELQPDDFDNSETADQMSQQDIHSNGFEDFVAGKAESEANPDALKQAYDAAEAASTLNLDKFGGKKP